MSAEPLLSGKHDQIAGALIQDILSGHYRVSERLPSERDLAVRFDANRGAVREAMKKLEQIGLADVQPGGARVKDKDEASLDVISHLLAQGSVPDATLMDQILVVINSLLSVAAEQTLELASEEEIEHIRSLVLPLMQKGLNEEEHLLARFELMHSIMMASQNLPLRLISRTLFDQVSVNLAQLRIYTEFDNDGFIVFAQQLDQALEQRDPAALRATFTAFSDLNRQSMMRAIATARADLGQEAMSQ